MEQLVAHLFGDYVLQPCGQWLAVKKTEKFYVALLHAFFYTLPFLLLTQSWKALLVVWLTHAVIDRWRLAFKWAKFVGVGYDDHWLLKRFGGSVAKPPMWLSVWLWIIVDNSWHLAINYCALRWL